MKKFALVLVCMLFAGAVAARQLGDRINLDFSFDATDLSGDGVHSRKCVSSPKGGYIDTLAINRSGGTGDTVDVWLLDQDVSATATDQAAHLMYVSSATGQSVYFVNQSFLTAQENSGWEMCVEVNTNGGTSIVEVRARGVSGR